MAAPSSRIWTPAAASPTATAFCSVREGRFDPPSGAPRPNTMPSRHGIRNALTTASPCPSTPARSHRGRKRPRSSRRSPSQSQSILPQAWGSRHGATPAHVVKQEVPHRLRLQAIVRPLASRVVQLRKIRRCHRCMIVPMMSGPPPPGALETPRPARPSPSASRYPRRLDLPASVLHAPEPNGHLCSGRNR